MLAKGVSELAEKIIEVHTGIVPVKDIQPKKKGFSLLKKK